jgi:hypothetical protein
MKTNFQNIINIGNFLEKYTKSVKSCNGEIPDLNAWCDPLVLARNVINNLLELLPPEIHVALRKREMMNDNDFKQ